MLYLMVLHFELQQHACGVTGACDIVALPAQMQVQDALRDDIDTATALRHLRQLVAAVQRVQVPRAAHDRLLTLCPGAY